MSFFIFLPPVRIDKIFVCCYHYGINKIKSKCNIVYKIYKDLRSGSKSYITVDDLVRYDKKRICKEIVVRFLQVLNTPTKNTCHPVTSNKVSFVTFVYYITFLEDKGSLSALNVWFRVCDDDGDGIISISELEELYNMQIKQIKQNSNE